MILYEQEEIGQQGRNGIQVKLSVFEWCYDFFQNFQQFEFIRMKCYLLEIQNDPKKMELVFEKDEKSDEHAKLFLQKIQTDEFKRTFPEIEVISFKGKDILSKAKRT